MRDSGSSNTESQRQMYPRAMRIQSRGFSGCRGEKVGEIKDES